VSFKALFNSNFSNLGLFNDVEITLNTAKIRKTQLQMFKNFLLNGRKLSKKFDHSLLNVGVKFKTLLTNFLLSQFGRGAVHYLEKDFLNMHFVAKTPLT
jgi:hypothetical protein